MTKPIELLAPGGDINAMKTAILAGADAIYCGLNKFNARNRAENISFEDLQGILRIAHQNDCEVFLTLNIIIFDSEIPELIKLLNRVVNTSIDGVIIQDFGLFYLINKYFPTLKIHASTQLTTHNKGQIQFLKSLNAERVNLSRELNLEEIKHLTTIAHQENVKTEVFVHGSYCISFSGLCYMSSLQSGNSGNRGQCSQPCRDRYLVTDSGKHYPLNLKDNTAFLDYKELLNAGVDSLKIEGRIKESEYVFTVVNAWRKQIDSYQNKRELLTDTSDLYKVFNRDFSNGFLKDKIDNKMFIDNPMNYSIDYLKEQNKEASETVLEELHTARQKEKEALCQQLNKDISQFDISPQPLSLLIKGEKGKALQVTITSEQKSFTVSSSTMLSIEGTEMLTEEVLLKRLKAINDTEYFIDSLKLELNGDLYLPFKELTSIKKNILYILNGQKHYQAPVVLPKQKKQRKTDDKPELSIIISSPNDLSSIASSDCQIFFQLPNSIKEEVPYYTDLFVTNKQLIPFFPAVLIGEEYDMAIELLNKIKPKLIVTNNTGIALEAYKKNIEWIAGPQLNISNSYSLVTLKDSFNCSGAFISNELSKQQIIPRQKPKDFKLYYSIYQPISLMTSRQCFFHQVSACSKHIIDGNCIDQCEKTASITHNKGDRFIIEKSKGNYHRIFYSEHMMNLDIAEDLGHRFSALVIDLSQIQNNTTTRLKKQEIITLFKSHISGKKESTILLNKAISPTANKSYEIRI